MKPGPKPLPPNVHLLRGNPSKKAFADLNDGMKPPVEAPAAPSHLTSDAKKEWKRIVPLLLAEGALAKIDMAALAVYCLHYARWRQAEKKIADLNRADPDNLPGLVTKMGTGYQQSSAWVHLSNRSVEIMYKFLCEFGMTPSARSRVTPGDLQPFLPGLEPAAAEGSEKPKATGFDAL